MKEQNTTELAMVKVEPQDITIPTTKLGFKQQEKYEEYGLRTISDIENMAQEIQSAKEEEYMDKNRTKVEESIMNKNPEIIKRLASIKVKSAKISDIITAKDKETLRLDAEIAKLENKIELNNASCTDKISNAFNELIPSCEDFRSKRIDGLTCSHLSVTLDRNERLITTIEFRELLHDGYIEDELKQGFKESQKNWFVMQEQIKDMRDNFKEVLLFNDERLEDMFRNLLKLKNKMKADYRKMKLE